MQCSVAASSPRYSVFFPHHSADDFCRHVFRTFDLNQDGVVDFRYAGLIGLLKVA